ncbi:hypothetical protein NLJ89_g6088 [Agrocybe chaxingu]|uniref:J domain-containing protein n=1 Tax=Agrocybe chaxingu TaxID=84603 RepID=A0A9W8JYZ0_9AGAR|nr:hypothetical protein NLJ89_g6088 [Agrocybe chaxingu]
MAAYEYDEAGVMAAYFLITFLALVLVPLTISALLKRPDKTVSDGCQCTPCIEQRKIVQKQERGSILNPKLSRRTYFLVGGWSLFTFVCYRVSLLKVENKIYNPFEILGISSSLPDKEIKSHFKKLSRVYHPDKVKATANMTIEMIQERFVQITKAYKSLTDERIKENWQKYNNPDGPQTTSMGIALPKWIIEGKNNIWVLGVYGLLFGGALPALVGRWWFGNRQKTKDGIYAQSAAAFFKTLKEESGMEDVVGALGKAYQWELDASKFKSAAELDTLEKTITDKLGVKWTEVRRVAVDYDGKLYEARRRALVLLYAHLLRLEIKDTRLKKQQKEVLLQTPLLLNALLNVSIVRTWLMPTLTIIRLYAFLAQALPPNASDKMRFTQLPGITTEDVAKFAEKAKERSEKDGKVRDMSDLLFELEAKEDGRARDVRKAMEKWGRVEIVDAAFKVIGETVIAPSSIIYLLVKLRITPPGANKDIEPKDLSVDETKKLLQQNEKIDEKFLESRLDAEELLPAQAKEANSSAHAPYWPGVSPTLIDPQTLLVDCPRRRQIQPHCCPTHEDHRHPLRPPGAGPHERDYRSYKMQFQGPPNTGLFTWKVYIVSDTFVGEEAVREITLKMEDPPVVDDTPSEDEISEPDEDSLAGQMAAMKGQPVKKRKEESSDDESSTDDDKSSDSDSSDSD